MAAMGSTRGGRIRSGTVVVLCMFLGGIALGLIALRFRHFESLPGPMTTTQPASQPATAQAGLPPAAQRGADSIEQR
jgi:hypothetical protein